MKNIKHLVALLAIALAVGACQKADPFEKLAPNTGKIISTEQIASYSAAQVDSVKGTLGSPILQFILPSEFGVDVYRVKYTTIDVHGNSTFASGALFLPRGTGGQLPLGCYMHGTVVRKQDVPSYMSYESVIGLLMAGAKGYAVAMPDYLGLGDSPGLHPYQHADSEASASIDMIRAVRNMDESDDSFGFNDKLFLYGYSQGGHATMATQRAIERDFADEFKITATAPMSGAYDMSETQARVMESRQPYIAPYYLPYLLMAYNEAYSMYPSLSDFFTSPQDSLLPIFFNGEYGPWHVDNAMGTDVPAEIIRQDVFDDYMTDMYHPFRVALRKNDTYNWTPKAPMLMCYCPTDLHVHPQNSLVTYNTFRAKGFYDVELYNAGNYTHQDCAIPSLLRALDFFETYR